MVSSKGTGDSTDLFPLTFFSDSQILQGTWRPEKASLRGDASVGTGALCVEPPGQVFRGFPGTLAGGAGSQPPFPALAVPCVPGGEASRNGCLRHGAARLRSETPQYGVPSSRPVIVIPLADLRPTPPSPFFLSEGPDFQL